MVNLSVLDKPEKKPYEKLVKWFNIFFQSSRPSLLVSNSTLQPKKTHKRLARLRALVVNCKFGQHLDAHLRDWFVIGMGKGPVRDRMFSEEAETITLDQLVQLANSKEAATFHYVLDKQNENITAWQDPCYPRRIAMQLQRKGL